jgi:hypothetical protein
MTHVIYYTNLISSSDKGGDELCTPEIIYNCEIQVSGNFMKRQLNSDGQ